MSVYSDVLVFPSRPRINDRFLLKVGRVSLDVFPEADIGLCYFPQQKI